MAIKEEGIWPCTITSANYGEDDRGVSQVQINGRIDDGPSKGMMFTYEDEVNARSGLYIGRSCKAVGWKGKTLTSLKADCSAWIAATGGKSTVEIKHIAIKKGKKYDAWVDAGMNGPPPVWDKANSIGRGPRVLRDATAQSVADADDAVLRAMAEDGGGEMPPRDDNFIPPAGDGDDIPF